MEYRDEVYHPLIVHFPIAILLLTIVFYSLKFTLCRWSRAQQWVGVLEIFSRTALYFGSFCLGLSLFTGDLAADVVRSNITDPLAISRHEDSAYWSLYLFMGAMLLDVVNSLSQPSVRLVGEVVQWFSLLGGGYFLVATTLDGMALVYKFNAVAQ